MSTNALCGFGGSVTGTDATEIKEWTITINQNTSDATPFSVTGWKFFVPCLKGASGSFKSNAPASIGSVAGTFIAGATGVTISGQIIINKVTDTTPVDGIVTFSNDFVFTGTITAAGII